MGHLYVLFGEASIQLCLFFNWVICLSGVELYEFFIYFGDQTFVLCIIGKYVLLYNLFSFHFDDGFFSCAEAFYFDEVPFVYPSLYVPCLGDISVKILLHGISEIFLPMFFSRTFIVSQHILKSFIHFEFILIYNVSWWPSFIFWHVPVQFLHLLKRLFLLKFMLPPTFLNIN